MMRSGLKDTVTLNNGVKMPGMGLGVWQVDEGREVEQSVGAALRAGYRSIDTASVYGNEGRGQGCPRERHTARRSVHITLLKGTPTRGTDSTLRAFEKSHKKLGMDYVDLPHPLAGEGQIPEIWRAFATLYMQGRVRAIGVSNFFISTTRRTYFDRFSVARGKPGELYPLLAQKECARSVPWPRHCQMKRGAC